MRRARDVTLRPMGDRLRPLWDFDDLDATERRFRAQLEQEGTDEGRAEVLTQLERGRLLRSSGDSARALPLFESAFEVADEAGEKFLAADAAHMAALAAPDRQGMLAWTDKGTRIAEVSSDPHVYYWLGPLLNNLGSAYMDSREYEKALDCFQQALEVRKRYPENPDAIQFAKQSVAEALTALGRKDAGV